MRATAYKLVALSSLLALTSCSGAFAQGMMEYGGLMGGGAGLGTGAASGLTGGFRGAAGGSQRSGTVGAINKRPRVDAETADAYAAASNKLFLQAQKKEKAGALAEAYTMYSQSADLRLKVWGDNDPAVMQIYSTQAKIALKQNKLPEAESTYRKMLAIVGRKNGPGSPEAKPIVSTLADILGKEKKYSDAASMYSQLVALEARTGGNTAPEALKSRMKMINSYLLAKKVNEAERSLKETILAVEAAPAPDVSTLVHALQIYSDLLKNEGRADEAIPLDARISALGGPPAGIQGSPILTPPPPITSAGSNLAPASTAAPSASTAATPPASTATTPPASTAATPPASAATTPPASTAATPPASAATTPPTTSAPLSPATGGVAPPPAPAGMELNSKPAAK